VEGEMSNVLSKLCLEQALHVPAAAKFLEKNFKKTLTNKCRVGYYYLTERLVNREQTEFGSQLVGRRSQNPTWKVAVGVTLSGNILEDLVGAMLLIRYRVAR